MGSVLTEDEVDAGEPERLTAFWAAVLGWEPTEASDGVVEKLRTRVG